MDSEFVLEMNHISKNYGDNCVLDDVCIRVRPGEIIALIGENGAGKSTIMNILFGMPVIKMSGGFTGDIRFNGEPVSILSPIDAANLGIGMVHQEFMLIDNFTVAENIKLNREIGRCTPISKLFGREQELIDKEATKNACNKVLKSLGISLDAAEKTGALPVGYKQFIEIARELDKEKLRVLVLDEPTAVLSEHEAEIFLNCVTTVSRRGVAVIFISHRLEEIKKITDRVYILKDGKMVGEYMTDDISVIRMSELMVGRQVEIQLRERKNDNTDFSTLLKLNNFSVNMPGESVHNINLSVRKGEILGIAGLSGHGKIGISNGVMGIYPSEGTVQYKGQILDVSDTRSTLKKGIIFVSEDRKGSGLMLDDDIIENITIEAMYIDGLFLKNLMRIRIQDRKRKQLYAEKMIKDLDIRCHSSRQIVRRLSGGNQQKVCLARALSMNPELLFISEPTRGIDIGAKKMILDYLLRLNRDKGLTIVITSSELAELRSISDRIAIIVEGKIAGILEPSDEDYKFGLMMSGITDFDTAKEST